MNIDHSLITFRRHDDKSLMPMILTKWRLAFGRHDSPFVLPQRPEHSAGSSRFPSGVNQHGLVPPARLVAPEYRLKMKLPFPLIQQHNVRSGRDEGFTVERYFFRSYSCGFKILISAALLCKPSTHNDLRRYE